MIFFDISDLFLIVMQLGCIPGDDLLIIIDF